MTKTNSTILSLTHSKPLKTLSMRRMISHLKTKNNSMDEKVEITQESVHVRWVNGMPMAVIIRNDKVRVPIVCRTEPASADEIGAMMGVPPSMVK